MSELTPLTQAKTGSKLKKSFERIKTFWEDKNKDIRKIEKKMEKMQEDLFVLKEERDNLEDELEGIRTTYQEFCSETGETFDIS